MCAGSSSTTSSLHPACQVILPARRALHHLAQASSTDALRKAALPGAEFQLAPAASSIGFAPGFVVGKPLGMSPGAASKCATATLASAHTAKLLDTLA